MQTDVEVSAKDGAVILTFVDKTTRRWLAEVRMTITSASVTATDIQNVLRTARKQLSELGSTLTLNEPTPRPEADEWGRWPAGRD